MNNVIILVGISGSGKSTWAKEFVKNDLNYLRVNRDDIRTTLVGNLNGYYNRKDLNKIEHIVTGIQEDYCSTILGWQYNVILDNTNLKREYIKFLLHEQSSIGYCPVQFKLFDCDLETAKNRVIRRDFYNRYEDQITLDTDDIDLSKSPEVDYIDKQYEQYNSIKKWLLEVYPDKIIK